MGTDWVDFIWSGIEQRKLPRVGFEPRTSRINLPALHRLSYLVLCWRSPSFVRYLCFLFLCATPNLVKVFFRSRSCIMAKRYVVERLRALNSSFGVSDQQSVGSSPPSCGICLPEQDTLPWLLCPSDGTLSCRSRLLGLVVHVKEPRTLAWKRRG